MSKTNDLKWMEEKKTLHPDLVKYLRYNENKRDDYTKEDWITISALMNFGHNIKNAMLIFDFFENQEETSKFQQTQKAWVIMDKARTVIAKGVPRNRYIAPISDTKKRLITYNSKGRAEAGFSNGYGFYDNYDANGNEYDLEAVEVEIIIKEV